MLPSVPHFYHLQVKDCFLPFCSAGFLFRCSGCVSEAAVLNWYSDEQITASLRERISSNFMIKVSSSLLQVLLQLVFLNDYWKYHKWLNQVLLIHQHSLKVLDAVESSIIAKACNAN
jgi:hypothetical protein